MKRICLVLLATVVLVVLIAGSAQAYWLQGASVVPDIARPGQVVTVTYVLGDDRTGSDHPYELEAWFGPKDASEFFNCGQTFGYNGSKYHSPAGLLPPSWLERASDMNTDGMTLIHTRNVWPLGREPGTEYSFDYTLPGDIVPGQEYFIHLLVGYPTECVNWTHYTFPLIPRTVSLDLDGQATGKTLEASVKIHPTIWMETFECGTYDASLPYQDQGVPLDSLSFSCLNPVIEENRTTELCLDWVIRSNLPFYKTIEIVPFAWEVPQPEALKSYQFIDGQWVLVENPAGAGPDDFPLELQHLFIDGEEIESGWVSEKIGDVGDHEDVERLVWKIGPIEWCTTAGYYSGELHLGAYQN